MNVFSPAAAASRAASWCPPAASAPSPSTRPCAPPGSDPSPCPESGGGTPAVTLSAHSDSWEGDKQTTNFPRVLFSLWTRPLHRAARRRVCTEVTIVTKKPAHYVSSKWSSLTSGIVEAASSQYISNNLWLLAVCLHTNINHTTCSFHTRVPPDGSSTYEEEEVNIPTSCSHLVSAAPKWTRSQ